MARIDGTAMIGIAAVAGVVVAAVNYLTPDNGIAGTPGALLVVGSTLLLALVAYAMRRTVRWGMPIIAAILVAGTAFAAWLLEALVLFTAMVLAALGWLMAVAQRGKRVG